MYSGDELSILAVKKKYPTARVLGFLPGSSIIIQAV